MKNRYEIIGDITVIYLNQGMKTVIDTSDLDKADSFPFTWCFSKKKSGFYVESRAKIDGKYTTVRLHRWLTDAPSGMVVDHKNGDGLDNKRSTNLRVVTNAQNCQNRTSEYPNSTIGMRNITLNGSGNYQVRITAGGVRHYIGTFGTLEEASRVAAEHRKILMPYSTK